MGPRTVTVSVLEKPLHSFLHPYDARDAEDGSLELKAGGQTKDGEKRERIEAARSGFSWPRRSAPEALSSRVRSFFVHRSYMITEHLIRSTLLIHSKEASGILLYQLLLD